MSADAISAAWSDDREARIKPSSPAVKMVLACSRSVKQSEQLLRHTVSSSKIARTTSSP